MRGEVGGFSEESRTRLSSGVSIDKKKELKARQYEAKVVSSNFLVQSSSAFREEGRLSSWIRTFVNFCLVLSFCCGLAPSFSFFFFH